MKKKQAGNILMIVLLLIQLAAEGALAFLVHRLHMLSGLYMGLLCVLLVLGLAVTGLIGLARIGRQKKATVAFRRSVAAILSVMISVLSLYAGAMAWKVTHTIDQVTGNRIRSSAAMAVFVKKDDPAKSIKAAASYSFGAMKPLMETADMKNALEDIKEQAGAAPVIQEFSNNLELVDSLYGGNIQAMIMPPSYVSLVEDQKGYEDFSDKVRILYEYKVEKKEPEPEPKKETGSITTTPFILYLSGSDTRSEYLDVSRSDVNILAVVNPKTKKVLLVNTPRDYYVPISVSDYTQRDKLTHCGIYGIQCSMDTLSHLYDLPINYYGQINFTGFEKLVDAVGGVTIYSDVAFTTSAGNVNVQVGENTFSGREALAFARERYNLQGGDNDRGKNQMKVLQAVLNKLSAQSILLHYSDILSSMEGMFVTDVSSDDISALIKMQLSDLSKWDISSIAVSGTGANETTYSMPGTTAYVMYPDENSVAQAKAQMEKVLNGQ